MLFYTAFIPAFISQGAEKGAYQTQFLLLAFSFMTIGFITKSTFAVFSGYIKNALNSKNANLMNYVSSVILFGLGVFLIIKSFNVLLT